MLFVNKLLSGHAEWQVPFCIAIGFAQECVFAEERTPSNPIAEDMQACKDLYDLTFEIVAQKAADIKGLAIPEPKQRASVK